MSGLSSTTGIAGFYLCHLACMLALTLSQELTYHSVMLQHTLNHFPLSPSVAAIAADTDTVSSCPTQPFPTTQETRCCTSIAGLHHQA